MRSTVTNSKQEDYKIKSLSNIFYYLKPYKIEIFFIILTLIITSAIILLLGKIIKYLIDLGFLEQDPYYLNLFLIGLIITIILLAITGYFRSFLVNSVGEKIIADLKKDIYAHIIRVSAEFFEICKTGDVISRLTVDTTLIYNILSNSIAFALRNFLLFFGGMIFLFLTSVKLTLVTLALIPFAILPIFIMGKKIKTLSQHTQEAMSLVGSRIEETINGIKTVQSYICENKEIENFNKSLKNALNISLEKIRFRSLLIALVIACSFSSVAIVLWYGGHLVLQSKITSGDLSSFIFYSIISATALVSISQIAGQLQTASAAISRLFALLQVNSPVIESTNPKELSHNKGYVIRLNNVSFSYPSRPNHLVLKDINLEILPKQKLTLIGQSGSGKSTILQLLMRFYDVSDGEILINDCNIKDLKIADLRNLFAYISQDCFIFSGTIYENIAYSNPNVTYFDVERIIDDNEALHFIKKLPETIHSFVGEKGVKLSGGEKQRIALARAIVKNAPIFLLDEATSALDDKNEEAIAQTLKKVGDDKIIITIAHKTNSISNLGKSIFLKNGKLTK